MQKALCIELKKAPFQCVNWYICDSLKNIHPKKSRSLAVHFSTDAFSPMFSNIIENFGDVNHTLSLNDKLSTMLSSLPLEKHCILINIDNWDSYELVPVIKDWSTGNANIRDLKVRGNEYNRENPVNWAEICSALKVQPISGTGYRKICHERFELRRQCDNKILDVTYYKHDCSVDLEEI